MDKKISVIVPTYNRMGLLRQHLAMYEKQTLSKDVFEVIVVNDGGSDPKINPNNYSYPLKVFHQENQGPSTARNKGVDEAEGEIVLFVGDDCLPHSNLLFRHLYNHMKYGIKCAVQGYSPWHPVVVNLFTNFLDKYNLQVNWSGAKNEDGSWRHQINSGYCVTTNYSIDRQHFLNMDGFDEDFRAAAWEDIEFGFRVMQTELPHFFDSGATNYHYHSYDINKFAKRQQTEGFWRVLLALKHPDFSANGISSQQIKEMEAMFNGVDKRLFDSYGVIQEVDDIVEPHMVNFLVAHSMKGIRKGIKHFDKRLRFILDTDNIEIIRRMFFATGALRRGDLGFALHCCEWIMEIEDAPFTNNFCAEIKEEIYGEKNEQVILHRYGAQS